MAFPPRRARRLLAYFLAERRTLRQGSVALLIGASAAFVAGITLGSITETLQRLPGLIILIPAVLSMRGTIFGAMGARLATSTHAGLFEVTRERTGVLYQNAFAGAVQTMSSSLYLAALAKVPTIYLATFIVRVHWLSLGVGIASLIVGLFVTVRGALTGLPLAR